jgi:hypothetical protein
MTGQVGYVTVKLSNSRRSMMGIMITMHTSSAATYMWSIVILCVTVYIAYRYRF